MKVLLSDLLSKRDRKKSIDLSLELSNMTYEGDEIKFLEPVKVIGELKAEEYTLVINASIKTKLQLNCSRCLGSFIYPIDIDIQERFTNNKESLDDDLIFVSDDSIDINELVESSIVSSLPIKKLCSEDCKGLCHTCGENLNNETCQCDNVEIDLRFEKLKELFGQ